MSASQSPTALAGFVAEAPVQVDAGLRRRVAGARALQDRSERPDAEENGLRRRALRQGLALMIGSSVLSILTLYGIWMLLSGAV